MSQQRFIWIFGLLGTGLIVFGTVFFLVSPATTAEDDPWAHVPVRVEGTDHTNLISGALADSGMSLETGPDVTRLCLTCHEDAAHEVMGTSHWTWQSEPVEVSWRDEPISIGKANTINNFCIGIQSNESGCTRCHAGYGWADETFDFTIEDNTDCLVCHDQSGGYVKASA
ncbi:MAG: cytochrome C, partial [Anaerolineae bacterium]|nr:cytochrome C [Anaerolineae bacterium]